MHGNELVTAVTIWTVGYVIGQIPVNLLLTRVPPRYVLCGVSLNWGQQLIGSWSSAGVSQPSDPTR
jgi:ACS family pantothenate transporter-like MFS transporter